MIKQIFKTTALLFVCFTLLSIGTVVLAYQSPIVNAGPDVYVNSGQTVTLQGSAYDPQGFNLIYFWNCSGGSLSNPNSAEAIFTASNPYNNSNNYSGQMTYTCSLTATDPFNLSSSAATTVFVNYNNNNNNGNYNVETEGATYISNFEANLNGTLSITNPNGTNYNSNYVFFQYGTTTNYGNETPQQTLGYSNQFFQNIENLNSATTYHYRAVSEGSYGTIYGQDMTFTTSGAGNGIITNYNTGSGTLSVTKQVINLSSGNLNWQASVNGGPGDVLSFEITIQSNSNQDLHNVFISDTLPSGFIYKGNLTLNPVINYSGSPQTGISIGTIPAGTVEVIAYQEQVPYTSVLPVGTSTFSDNSIVTSTEGGTQSASASVIINNPVVLGAATTVSTGLTNNPITDSFFLPVMLIILGSYLYFSGKIYIFADWISEKIK